ncbi:arginine--tRNA ligase [Candidatus Falkowbacteria bacterium]|nr:arginine--tRNA ligase [Candidatus Falkowbacteria bacterium]
MSKISQNFSQAEFKARGEISELIKKNLGKNFDEETVEIEYPPESKLGDYSVPCFLLAKKLKQNPAEVAKKLSKEIKPAGLIKNIVAVGPYVNFFVDAKEFSKLVLLEIFRDKQSYGRAKIGKGKKVMVEYFSPNTNKPLTIGHVRNIALGQSIAGILKFTGHKVVQSTLYNDRGIAIAKAILGYQKWGGGKTPRLTGEKPDHFVGKFYVKFAQEEKKDPNLEQEAKRVLQAWENDERKVKVVWERLMSWVLEGFKQTLKKLGVASFDEEYYESEFYSQGKEMVEKGLKKGVFVKNSEGVALAPLEKYGLPDKIVLRPDDTSLYVTQDLYLAFLKNKYKMDTSVYVVGSEQDLYFKQLFKILELLGFASAKNYYHLSYGMVRLPSGKIKSREGLAEGTGADEIISQLEELAKKEIKERDKNILEKELNKRAEQIAIAALKFYILAVNPKTTMVFEPQKSIAFTGRTGPYLMYVYARINSIFEKAKTKLSAKTDFSVLENELEFELIRLLSRFPRTVAESAKNFNPSDLANYLYELAKSFSLFYETLPVLKADERLKKARLFLISDVQTVLGIGLDLLGIGALKKM